MRASGAGFRRLSNVSDEKPLILLAGVTCKVIGMIARTGELPLEEIKQDESPFRPIEDRSATIVLQGSI